MEAVVSMDLGLSKVLVDVPMGGRGAQGFQPPRYQGNNNTNFYRGESSGISAGDARGFANQLNFDGNGVVFGGDFGDFDEGFYDGGNIFGQGG
jgi:hypothetical protein